MAIPTLIISPPVTRIVMPAPALVPHRLGFAPARGWHRLPGCLAGWQDLLLMGLKGRPSRAPLRMNEARLLALHSLQDSSDDQAVVVHKAGHTGHHQQLGRAIVGHAQLVLGHYLGLDDAI